MPENELSANRSVALELREERRLVQEGYDFLDEKRVLLATEILKRLAAFEELRRSWAALQQQAAHALLDAAGRHGLDGLAAYPAHELTNWQLESRSYRVAGVLLADEVWRENSDPPPLAELPINPSPEARVCGELFRQLLRDLVALASHARNLKRLAAEYRRTERRARALESVLMPELDATLRFVEEQLESYDLEEAIRVHEASRRHE